MAIERIHLLDIPIDILSQENVEKEILDLLNKPGTKSIVFLSVWDFLKAHKNGKFGECIKNATLVLPTSKSLLKGVAKLGLPVPLRYNPFTAIISLLSILDNNYKTLYLFGGRKGALSQAEKNVHATFSNIRLVGRYVGYYPKNVESQIILAMYKSSPSVVLLGDGIPGKVTWPYNNRNRFASSTFVYYRDIINIFAKRSKRVSDKTFEKGNEIWIEILHNPLKIFLIFPYMKYKLLLLMYKLKNK